MFTAGIDVGTVNMSISFVSSGTIITYIGSLYGMKRYELNKETQELLSATKKADGEYKALVNLLSKIPEFANTSATIIELQLSVNASKMSRLDGIVYGFLSGRYSTMNVFLSGSTIRKKFITDQLAGKDLSVVKLPKGIKESKIQSFQYVGIMFKEYYDFIDVQLAKIDDICDSIVYASIASIKT